MVADAMASDRMIGMVLLRPGGSGITKAAGGVSGRLQRRDHPRRAAPDGRYNIVLRGLERFRIVDEDDELQLPARQHRTVLETHAGRRRPRG